MVYYNTSKTYVAYSYFPVKLRLNPENFNSDVLIIFPELIEPEPVYAETSSVSILINYV